MTKYLYIIICDDIMTNSIASCTIKDIVSVSHEDVLTPVGLEKIMDTILSIKRDESKAKNKEPGGLRASMFRLKISRFVLYHAQHDYGLFRKQLQCNGGFVT